MFLLEGKHAPNHAAIARFRSIYLSTCIKETFAWMDYRLEEFGKIFLENLFIDGTKIEAFADKVWKKAVTKNVQKLIDKITTFMVQMEKPFGLRVMHNYHLKRLYRNLKRRQYKHQIIFADVKQDLQLRRFLGRGNANARIESMSLAIAHNIGKMHHKI